MTTIGSNGHETTLVRILKANVWNYLITSDPLVPNPNAILHIITPNQFTQFTNSYGYQNGSSVWIKWNLVARDFKGLCLVNNDPGQSCLLYDSCFFKVDFGGVDCYSWWDDEFYYDAIEFV